MQPCKVSSAFIHCVHIHAVVPREIDVAGIVEKRCLKILLKVILVARLIYSED